MTEPSALRVVPDEEVSGLWLWHGAPPDRQPRQRVPRRGARRLSVGGGVLIVAALSAIAAFVLIEPRLPEPTTFSGSSAVAIATPTSLPPAVDAPASPRAAVDRLTSPAAVAGAAASAPASAGTPTGMPAEPPALDRAAEGAPLRASAPATQGVSSQVSHPVAPKPAVVRRHRDPRVARQTGTSLTDLLATPAFRDGTLRPVQDH